MKLNLFKSVFITLIALTLPFLQQTTHAQQAYNSSKVKAQTTIYLMVDELNKVYSNVDFGDRSIDETKYDGEIFTLTYSFKDVDVRFATSDFVILQLHNLFTIPEKRKNFEQISSILRQAESKLRLTFRDDAGHEISHIFSPDDIDELMTKSIEELGIDKEQMANYCIFYYNNTLQHQIDGTEILSAKAIKEGNFVKLIYTTSYSNNTISFLTPELIKEFYIHSIGSMILVEGQANQLKAFGFDGLILEYTNQQGASAKATITIDDLLHSYDDYNVGVKDLVEEEPILPLDQNPFIIQAVKEYDLDFKDEIGKDGVVDAYAYLKGEYIEITEVLDGITDDISSYIPEEEYKEMMYVVFAKNEEALNEFEQLQQHGLKGLIFTYINQTDKESVSITLDIVDLFEFVETYNNESNTIPDSDLSVEDIVASLSEEEKKTYNDLFLKAIEEGAKAGIGTNGVKDVYTYTSGEYVTILYSMVNISDLSENELATLKANVIQMIRECVDTEVSLPIFQLTSGLKGIKYICKGDNSYKSATITIDFDEITNASNDTPSYSYNNNEYDFSNANTDELREIFIQEISSSMKKVTGEGGLTDTWAELSGNTLVMNFTYDSTIDLSDLDNLDKLKDELIQDMTDTEEDLEICIFLYYLDIMDWKFVIQRENSNYQKSFTISIEEIVNGTFNPEKVQYNEI